MVTARQIQQLTRQRLEGRCRATPSSGSRAMVRRGRRIMNRGGILYGRRAKTLPRLKPGGRGGAGGGEEEADGRRRAPRGLRRATVGRGETRADRAGAAVIAGGGGADEHALRLPVRPLAWPQGPTSSSRRSARSSACSGARRAPEERLVDPLGGPAAVVGERATAS